MWNARLLSRMDMRVIPVIVALMAISLIVISAQTVPAGKDAAVYQFLTPRAKSQLQWFVIGWGAYLLAAGFDYNRLREATWVLYLFTLFLLIGLFFTPATQRVHRWYMVPGLHLAIQPSELAKLVVVFALAWYLERQRTQAGRLRTAIGAGVIAGLPFLLILKQPDLGTALVLWPITLVMFYFGGIHPRVMRWMNGVSALSLAVVLLFVCGLLDHERMRPYATKFVKEYQYERLNPESYHHACAVTAIGVGGVRGTGFRKGEYAGRGWLPAADTDSVFPAFGEEFGLLGMVLVLVLFYSLIYFGFQVTAVAKDHFGRLLSAGITVYIAMHVLTNIAMMCGLLPITGVPLLLITRGGSSTLVTMAALGVLQSVYSRRFMF